VEIAFDAPQWAAVFDIGSVPQTPIGPPYWPYLGCFSVTIDAVAGVAFFLATDDASYVSGVNLLVDGGWMAYRRRNDRASPTSPDARRAGTSRDSSCAPSSSRTTA
jgi:NAD(P)-dependent dehydrogenase (short-subunit alcohol dehydrogenase family)